MENGISKDWSVIREDEDKMKKKAHNEEIYIKYKETFDKNAKRWDLMNPEKKREIRRNYEKRNSRYRSYARKRNSKKRERRKYLRRKLKNTTPKIVCLYGVSGAGKTWGAAFLAKKYGFNLICSCTTRPMRTGEVDGVDHWFVKDVPPMEQLLAYTKYGDYEYYARKSDVKPGINIYVVDEVGIQQMLKDGEYRIYPVRIDRSITARRSSGVTWERIERDDYRVPLGRNPYRAINNWSTRPHFKKELVKVMEKIIKS